MAALVTDSYQLLFLAILAHPSHSCASRSASCSCCHTLAGCVRLICSTPCRVVGAAPELLAFSSC